MLVHCKDKDNEEAILSCLVNWCTKNGYKPPNVSMFLFTRQLTSFQNCVGQSVFRASNAKFLVVENELNISLFRKLFVLLRDRIVVFCVVILTNLCVCGNFANRF